MRRSAPIVLATLALAVGSAGVTACSSAARTPTVAHTHFTPTAQLDVHSCPRLPAATGAPCDEGLSVQPASDPLGAPLRSVADHSVLVVKNLAADTRRVTGMVKDDQVFDTGQMKPGNTTTVVLSTPGGLVITDTTTGEHVTLIVRPAPAAKS